MPGMPDDQSSYGRAKGCQPLLYGNKALIVLLADNNFVMTLLYLTETN